MKKSLIYTLMISLIIIGLVLSACAPTAGDPKVVTLAWTQEPDTLNRAYSNMWYMSVLTNLYSCWPWAFDDSNEAYPSMITEMPSLSADGLEITMTLRDDLVWSDGTAITADDFLFTQQMILSQSNAVDSVYPYDLFETSAPDAQTVVMTFEEPFTPWMSSIWQGDLMPKHILEPVYESEGSIDAAEWNFAPTVGCGPFNFTEWESGSYLRFDRNEEYWGELAKLDTVYFQLVPDDAAQTAAVLAGDADIAFWPPYEDIPAFQEAGLNIFTQASGYNEGWFFNLRDMASPGIKDLVVRKAIAMSLDRESNTDIRLGVVSTNETLWDALPAYVSPDIEPYPFDPEGAKQMLEEAGYVDSDNDGIREDLEGNPLVITQGNTTKEERQNYQAVAQQQLLEVGIDLQIQSFDGDILFASYADAGPAAIGDLDIMQWSDAPYFPDPDTPYWLCSELATDEYPWGYNYYICDEALDALFQEQVVTTDLDARIALFHQITKYMHDNLYYLGIWEDPDTWIVNPALTNVKFSGVTPFYNIAEWDIVP